MLVFEKSKLILFPKLQLLSRKLFLKGFISFALLPCYKFQIFRKHLKSTNLGDFWHYLQRRYNFFLEHLDRKWRGQYIYINRNYIFLSALFSKEGTLKILGESHFSIQNSGETSQENKKHKMTDFWLYAHTVCILCLKSCETSQMQNDGYKLN